MKKAALITFVYALIIFAGGLVGHLKAKSTVSLIMGIIYGILLIFAAIGMYKDKLLPTYFGLILILMLDAFFTYRWLISFQFMPAGLMTLISIAALLAVVLLVKNHLQNPKKNHR